MANVLVNGDTLVQLNKLQSLAFQMDSAGMDLWDNHAGVMLTALLDTDEALRIEIRTLAGKLIDEAEWMNWFDPNRGKAVVASLKEVAAI